MDKVNQLQAYNKMWAAVISSILTLIVTYFGLNLDPVLEAAFVTVVTAAAVWAVPNR